MTTRRDKLRRKALLRARAERYQNLSFAAKMEAVANQLLAKSGYFNHPHSMGDDENTVEAEAISAFGLRPTWHGRA